MTPQALAVKTPDSTLPPPASRDPNRAVIGGDGLATGGLTVPGDAPPLPSSVAARGWLVADLDTGAVLGACGPHEQHAPASVQKLLLAAALMDKLDPKQAIQVTKNDLAIERGSSAVGLVTGGTYTIETLWLGLLLVSGNDAANVLARAGGGDAGVAGAMQALNDFAHHLGAKDTNAVTPSGLDAPGQFTTPYDLALIAKACLDLEAFRRYALTRNAQIPPQPPNYGGFQIQNENKLIYRYEGALGGKTGFTKAARHSYVGAAERNGRRLVVTILNAEATPQRAWQQGIDLLDWGFGVANTSAVGQLVKPGEIEASAAAANEQQAAADTDRDEAGFPASLGTPAALAIGVAILLLAIMVVSVAAVTEAQRRKRRRQRHPPVSGRQNQRPTDRRHSSRGSRYPADSRLRDDHPRGSRRRADHTPDDDWPGDRRRGDWRSEAEPSAGYPGWDEAARRSRRQPQSNSYVPRRSRR